MLVNYKFIPEVFSVIIFQKAELITNMFLDITGFMTAVTIFGLHIATAEPHVEILFINVKGLTNLTVVSMTLPYALYDS